MKTTLRARVPAIAAAGLIVSLLLGACGGGSALPVVQPSKFPTTQNLPMLQITNRVINLNAKTGYQYAKLSIDVLFADPSGQFLKTSGDNLAKLQAAFAADNSTVINAFNDVLTTDVSQKTPQELGTDKGKEDLRTQLIQHFNDRLPPGGPTVVYIDYVDFVMQ